MKKCFYIIAILAALVVTCSREEPTIVNRDEAKRLPDQELVNFTVRTTTKGKLEVLIHAGHMRRFSKESLMLFDNGVKVDFFDAKGEHASTLTSDGAEYDDDTKDVKAIGNVVVVSDSGVTLYTDELFYYRESGKIISNKPVKVETDEGHILHGVGFESDAQMDSWEIREPYDGVAPQSVDLSTDRFAKKEIPDSLAADSTMLVDVVVDSSAVVDSIKIDTTVVDTKIEQQ